MDVYRDIRLLFVALRDRLIDPDRLASAAADWSPPTGLIAHLAGRGVISPETLEHLQAARLDEPAAVHDGDPSLRPTPRVAGDGEATTDHPGSAGDTPAGSERDGFNIPALAGRYSILRLHQSGGLGQVWVARDLAVGRDVALKTLRPERVSGETARSRFIREARVTGQLEHPSIVPLYDLADNGADPFYVMRFISGRTLAEAAADYHKRRAAGTTGPLDLNTLLDAFINVCRAVAFAHSRNVLHRDLKGQNVVVGEYGETFLLDWGLAKSVGEVDESAPTLVAREDGVSDLTETGAAVGTPAYMAPEVAAGRPATKASDVYGLGAILHAVLAGRPPYSGSTAAEVLQKLAMSVPAAVTDSNPTAPPALVAVCRRAMARNPSDRYASAEEVATEVRRWLADEPVHAYREPFPARAARWARRRKTAVVAAGVLLATAAVASSAAAGLLWREEQKTATAKTKAEEEWQRAEKEKTRAEGNFALAWDMAADLGTLVELNETGAAPTPASLATRKALVQKAVSGTEQILAARPEDPDLQARTARILRYAANLGRALGDSAAAEKAYESSAQLLESLLTREPADPAHQSELSLTLRNYSSYQMQMGRLSAGVKSIDRAIAIIEKLPPDNRGDHRWFAAIALLNRSDLEYAREQLDAAEQSATRAAALLDEYLSSREFRPHPLAPLFRAMTANRLAIIHRERLRGTDAEPTSTLLSKHDDAVDRFRALLKTDEGADVVHNYCRALSERARTTMTILERAPEAAKDLDEAIQRWELLTRQYSQVPMYREGLARALLLRVGLRTRTASDKVADAAIVRAAEGDLKNAISRLERLAGEGPKVPGYRALLGEGWRAQARLTTDPKILEQSVDRSLSSFRAARNRDPENPRHPRMLEEVIKEWPEVAARVNARRAKSAK